MFNFREITEEILESGAGIQVEKGESLARILKELLSNLGQQKIMGEKGYQIIQKNRGAVERNLAIVEKFLI
jgi:3-deoxy-D-manno-octulosonic-acid transferase